MTFPISKLLPVLLSIALASCVSQTDSRYAHYPKLQRDWISNELRQHPDSDFSRAFGGDADSLHSIFKRVPELDGGASEFFPFYIGAIRSAIGDERFFAALARESAEIQREMSNCAQRSQSRP